MKPDATVLFISHKKEQCGVYQFGLGVSTALQASRRFAFCYVECNDADTFLNAVDAERPAAIIYNHHPTTMPWLSRDLIRPLRIAHVGVMHENTQSLADLASNELFDYHIAPDPTLLLRNPIVFKTGRLVPAYAGGQHATASPVPTIGSFGFGTPGKGFARLISKVQDDFDHATVKLRIPYSAFFDADGGKARAIADECRSLIAKPGIDLQIDHDFLSQHDLMDFLAGNSLNAFLYEEQNGRGISSVIDFALAVGRPLAVTRSSMFRHVNRSRPSIVIEESRLSEILARGPSPVARFAEEWTAENLVWDYERIVATVLGARATPRRSGAFGARSRLLGPHGIDRLQLRRASRALLRQVAPAVRSAKRMLRSWPLRGLAHAVEEQPIVKAGLGATRAYFSPNVISAASPTAEDAARDGQRSNPVPPYRPNGATPHGYNRILGTSAWRDYQPAIEYLLSFVPGSRSRKSREKVTEQAFILDTVSRLTRQTPQASLLGIGSHGEPASVALAMSGHHLEEVDPVVNYDLGTYMTKPTRKQSFFDVVFAPSSIGDTAADAQFLKQVEDLLTPGGVGVLTCAFDLGGQPRRLDSWWRGRALSSRSLDRLLPLIDRCELVDPPHWQLNGDELNDKAPRLTVASMVFRKVRQ